MKNAVIVLMGIIIAVLAAVVGRTSERLKRAGPTGEIETLRGYLELVERYSQITRDSSKSGSAAVIYTKELFKNTPPETTIAFFSELLPQTQDPATQRAIRFELVDRYLHAPKPDKQKALEQLKILIIGSAGPTTSPSSLATP